MYYFTEKTLKLNNIADAIENSKKTYYEQEYQKVLDLYEIKEFPKYEYEFSKVIYRNIYKYFNEMTILKGKDANLKEHMAVINDEGLIGVISKVYKNTAKVELLTNKDINVSVKINEVYGMLHIDNFNELIVDSITNYDNVAVGDYIYTSGLGNLPANIYIGKVKEIKKDQSGISKTLIVDKTIDFNKLDYVAVLKNGVENE